jgi:hypothetical protein
MSVPQKNEEIAPQEFTPDELQAMHRWCLIYRDAVRSGITPTLEQDAQFILFARVIYAEGYCDA